MSTKTAILKTALALYNESGVRAITSRHIAAEMGISPGNLHYHFKTTDSIIIALYNEMVAGFDALAAAMEFKTDISLTDLREGSENSFELMYGYRFLFLHFVDIGIRIPSIREDYLKLTKRRMNQFIAIFQHLITQGVFRNDLPDKILQAFVTQIFIVFDFWLSNNELTLRLRGKDAVAHYNDIFFSMLYPYLTPDAQLNFNQTTT